MGHNVIFIRPVEKVGIVHDILTSCSHSNFPVVDTDDGGVLDGTIGRNDLCILLQQRAFGRPCLSPDEAIAGRDFIVVEHGDNHKYIPLVQWAVVEKAYPKYPRIEDVDLSADDRECLLDLRPYINTAAFTVQESASAAVSIGPIRRCSILASCILASNIFPFMFPTSNREHMTYSEVWAYVSCPL
jgi:chloride channel 7